jgi:hypothetical protein
LVRASRVVRLFEPAQESRQILGHRRDIPAESDRSRAKLPRHERNAFLRVGVLDDKQALGQSRAELPMLPFDESTRSRRSRQLAHALVDHLLHFEVCHQCMGSIAGILTDASPKPVYQLVVSVTHSDYRTQRKPLNSLTPDPG